MSLVLFFRTDDDGGKKAFNGKIVGQVRMYPPSTEIDVQYLNEDESENRVEVAKSGTIGRESEDSDWETKAIFR